MGGGRGIRVRKALASSVAADPRGQVPYGPSRYVAVSVTSRSPRHTVIGYSAGVVRSSRIIQ